MKIGGSLNNTSRLLELSRVQVTLLSWMTESVYGKKKKENYGCYDRDSNGGCAYWTLVDFSTGVNSSKDPRD
jgi:hypothetical protein